MPNPIPALTEALVQAKRKDILEAYDDGIYSYHEAVFKLMDTGLVREDAETLIAIPRTY